MSTVNPWIINEGEYPTQGSLEEKIRFWLRYAILAPTAHNNQPWRCKISESSLELYLDPAYITRFGTQRQNIASLGTFVENLRIAARHFGYNLLEEDVSLRGKITDRVAQLRFQDGYQASSLDHQLFTGICQRHTNRGLYDSEPLTQEFIDALTHLPLEHGLFLNQISEQDSRSRVANLVSKGVFLALSIPTLRKELAEFVHFQHEQSDTGMYVEAMYTNPEQLESGKQWLMEKLDVRGESAFCKEKFETAPLQVVFSSQQDGPAAWLHAGSCLQRSLNLAASFGLSHCISAAPIEIPILEPLLRRELSQGGRPQALVRFGKPKNPEFTFHSPRRSADSIVF